MLSCPLVQRILIPGSLVKSFRCSLKCNKREGEMRTKANCLILTLFLVFSVHLTVIGTCESREQIVKVGDLTDMTGPVSPELMPISQGTAVYFKDLNKKGGLKGIKFDIDWVDTKYQLASALAGYERLKNNVLVFYTSMSHASTALKANFAQDKIPCVTHSSATIPFYPPGWLYGFAPTHGEDLAFLGDFLLENWTAKRPMRVALVYTDDTTGRSIFEGGVQYMKAKGIEIAEEGVLKMGSTDATSQLLRIQKADPDYIFCQLIGATQSVVLRDRQKLGIKIPVATAHGAWAEDLVKMAGADACEGVITARSWGLATDNIWGVKYGNQLIESQLTEWSGKPAGVYLGIATGMVIVEAVRLAVEKVGFDKLKGDAIKEFGFDQIRNFDTGGLTSKITYTPTDHRGGISERILKIVGGKPIVIRDWTVTPVCKP